MPPPRSRPCESLLLRRSRADCTTTSMLRKAHHLHRAGGEGSHHAKGGKGRPHHHATEGAPPSDQIAPPPDPPLAVEPPLDQASGGLGRGETKEGGESSAPIRCAASQEGRGCSLCCFSGGRGAQGREWREGEGGGHHQREGRRSTAWPTEGTRQLDMERVRGRLPGKP